MTTTQYLDAVKRRLGLPSDYALAKRLGLSHQAIGKLRRGAIMSNTTAAVVSELLALDLVKVIADLELERGSNDELWRRIAKRVAVVVLGATAGALAVPPSPDEAGQAEHAAGASDRLCIMLNRRRRLDGRTKPPAWLRALLTARLPLCFSL